MIVGQLNRENAAQTLLAGQPHATCDHVSPAISQYLHSRLFVTACLTMRASAEAMLRQPGTTVAGVTGLRAMINRSLREKNLWENLDAGESELLAHPEGAWRQADVGRLVEWREHLRVLRWVTGIDRAVQPLSRTTPPDMRIATEILQREYGTPARVTLWASDLRIERDGAAVYLARVMAELQFRGLETFDSDGQWAATVQENFRGDSADLLLGSRVVGELTDEELRAFGAVVAIRYSYAAYLTELLDVSEPFGFAAHAAPDALGS